MKKVIPLDFIIDKLTNSIENVRTGDSFSTDITLVSAADIKGVTKKKGWAFDWKYEFDQPERDVYKLTIVNNSSIIQGLICIQMKEDHAYMHLIENAPFNKGKNKVYAGVAGNLVAYACKLSYQLGFEGYLSFASKTSLIEHYISSLGARYHGGLLMVIHPDAAMKLIQKYFKNYLP